MKKLLLLLPSVILATSMSLTYGQVGIGTTTPQEQLHVSGGDLRVDNLSSVATSNVLADTNGKLIIQQRIMGKVNPNGTSSKIVGATSVRVSTGNYRITFDQPLLDRDYIILLTIRRFNNSRNDPNTTYYNQDVNGFNVEIKNNDDGNSNGSEIDLEFMFKVEKIEY